MLGGIVLTHTKHILSNSGQEKACYISMASQNTLIYEAAYNGYCNFASTTLNSNCNKQLPSLLVFVDSLAALSCEISK